MSGPGRSTPAKPLSLRAAAVCCVLAAFWGGTPTAIRLTDGTVPPILGGGLRFALAAVFMLGWCLARRERVWPRAGEWGPCAILGGFLFVQIGLYHVGVLWTNASHAALLINTLVFWAAATEHFVTRDDRLTPSGGPGW